MRKRKLQNQNFLSVKLKRKLRK